MIINLNINKELLDQYQIFDIRTKAEWRQTGIISGSILISLNNTDGTLNEDFLNKFQKALDPSKPPALICASGYRSSMAANLIKKKLKIDIINLRGGMSELLDQGYISTPYLG